MEKQTREMKGMNLMKKGVVSIVSALAGAMLGMGVLGNWGSKKIQKVQATSDKHLALFLMMNQWVKIKQDGKNLSSYFMNNGYRKIAVYGMSYVGETLLEELKDSAVEVVYGIDKNAEGIEAEVEIVSPDNDFKEVDAIVVTAISFFDDIEEKLSGRVNCPILSLEDILYEI